MKIRGVINRPGVMPAVLVISFIVLVGVSAALVNTVYRAQRAYIADHLQANLQATVDYIQLIMKDQLAQVSVIAGNKAFMSLAGAALASPSDNAAKIALEEWLSGAYPNKEKYGYALLTVAGTISASTVRELEGSPLQRKAFLDLLDRLQRADAAVTPLIESVRPSSLAPVGALFQVACAHIRPGEHSIGYFCLVTPAASRLFDALTVARTGITGEAYLIDAQARMKSPSRFLDQAATLYARVPATSSQAARNGSAPARSSALTKVADALLTGKRKQTGYLENYRDYRGVLVVGVGQWRR